MAVGGRDETWETWEKVFGDVSKGGFTFNMHVVRRKKHLELIGSCKMWTVFMFVALPEVDATHKILFKLLQTIVLGLY